MTTYRLAYAQPAPVAPPVLDEFQQSVVDHPGGPLLVLAGPGTGKTTTLVEAVVDRIERRGASPDSVLALTFSRKAAEQLRDRVTARLGRTLATTLSSTFHSFAYGLVRRWAPPDLYAAPLRLLSAPEQDVVLAELLSGNREGELWPPALRQALGTRGFAREVQTVLARAREKGLDPVDLKALGEEAQAPELVAAARFMQQYQVILDDQSAIDYPELIHRAVLLAEQPEVRAQLRGRFAHVFVDEYQDTDPSQVRLLRAIAGDGRDLTVVGDPDQSIYGFRGAEVRGILDFPRDFPRLDGRPADTVALRVTRRFGPRLLRLSRSVVSGLATTGSIDAETFTAFRSPTPQPGPHGPGRADVATFDTERAETEHVADLLRRAHLEDGVPWSEIAVLVRSGRASIPRLRRALGAAGVPVEVAADDTPLAQEPAVLPLLDALRAVVDLADRDDLAAGAPDRFGPDRAEALLTSPVGALDATEVRSLARLLRHRELQRQGDRSSPELLRDHLLDPDSLEPVAGRPAARVRALGTLLRRCRGLLDAGATAEEVLWELWSGTDWPRRLRSGVDLGGQAARFAHRDLDAVCALFEVAARAEEQRGHTSVVTFLETLRAQEIPADTLAERGVRGGAVRLLTAHRSKGLEWRFVVVAHVQDEAWPDLRRRSSLLHADRIGHDGLLPPLGRSALLAEERRLFYVACTRARERLLVTAVASPEDDGEQPSRFVDELTTAAREDGAAGFVRHRHLQGRPSRPLSLDGLVADLRRTLSDPATSAALRRAAADRLAVLAEARHEGRPLAPAADPGRWWGTRARSLSPVPVERPDEPVTISASTLEAILSCPVKWFLERRAGGETPSSQSQAFGMVVHTLADRVAKREIAVADRPREEVLTELMAHVDTVWGSVTFRTPWSPGRERDEVEAALGRFLDWHTGPAARTLVATEQRLTTEVTLPDGQLVRLNGYADRLELDADGRVVVVDLKTTKHPPTGKELPDHPQLGLYQHAVAHGAVDDLVADLVDGPATPGGAELVQLRKGLAGGAKVQQQPPQQPGEDGCTTVERQLMLAAAVARGEVFDATPGRHCEHCSFHAACPTKAAGTVLS
ncbi:MAG TPA: ATP-dependent DNA helicase [Nocardioidaceae bacterium]|nr:ATP-dependent DNA helicase [Nocardioidaceae bacterium]